MFSSEAQYHVDDVDDQICDVGSCRSKLVGWSMMSECEHIFGGNQEAKTAAALRALSTTTRLATSGIQARSVNAHCEVTRTVFSNEQAVRTIISTGCVIPLDIALCFQ